MCKVLLTEKDYRNLSFIMFNLIFSRKQDAFTNEEAICLAEKYQIPKNEVNKIIKSWLNNGFIKENIWDYQIIR